MFGKIFKIIINTILALLIILGIFVIFSFIPFPGNYRVFTVQSGSMEPAIKTGSLIFVKPKNEYKTEDIVTRKTDDPKVTITHRVVEVKNDDGRISYLTKGDANDSQDMETVPSKDVIGKMIWGLPLLGYPVSYAKTVQGLILLVVVPSVIIIYDEAQKIKKEILLKIDYRRRMKKRQADEDKEDETKQNPPPLE